MRTPSPFISRYEIKYLIPETLAPEISRWLRLYAVHDPHTPPSHRMQYTVRSIYFDTPSLEFYYQKLDGIKVRKKLRIRTYGHVKDFAFLEIKRRFIDIVVKERAKFHTTELEELFEEGHRLLADHSPVPYKSRLVAGKFLYSLVKMPLLPTLLVVYEREAFLHPLARYQRATVDMNMRYVMHPDLVDLFHTDGAVRWNQPNAILELKFNDFMPKWMRRLEAEYGLRQQAISKYCYGIDVCQQDIHKEVSACRQTFWKLSS